MPRRARYSVRLPVTPAGAETQVRDRAGRTEEQLTQWRTLATGRRRAFELAQWVAAEQARRRRRRWVSGLRGVVTTMMVFALTVGAVALQSGPAAEARSPETIMREDAASELISGVVAAESPLLVAAMTTSTASFTTIEPVTRVAPLRVEAPAEVAEPLRTETFAGPPALEASDTVGVAHASITQWDDEDYRWISFQVETDEPTWMRWRDPSGAYPIEAMPCAFPTEDGHECRAGRSHWRLAKALEDGARPGTWTIEACVGDVCEAVDTVEIGGR